MCRKELEFRTLKIYTIMETIQVRILQASDGKYLYNGNTICRYVQLAPTANADDWREITEEEKVAIEEEQDRKANEERDAKV